MFQGWVQKFTTKREIDQFSLINEVCYVAILLSHVSVTFEDIGVCQLCTYMLLLLTGDTGTDAIWTDY